MPRVTLRAMSRVILRATPRVTLRGTPKDADEQNKAYFKRMRKALEAGEDFDEPLPKIIRHR